MAGSLTPSRRTGQTCEFVLSCGYEVSGDRDLARTGFVFASGVEVVRKLPFARKNSSRSYVFCLSARAPAPNEGSRLFILEASRGRQQVGDAMKKIAQVLWLLFSIASVTPLTFTKINVPETFGGGQLIQWDTKTMVSVDEFPCVKDEPSAHPKNCSLFYLCRKMSERSNIYHRYLYECPEGQIYSSSLQECESGRCFDIHGGGLLLTRENSKMQKTEKNENKEAGSGVEDPMKQDGEEVLVKPEGEDAPGNKEDSTSGSGSEKIEGFGLEDESGNEDTLPSIVNQNSSVVASSEVNNETEVCSKYLYVQLEGFCNLFRRCDDTKPDIIYSCVKGTAFKLEAQMCRITSFDQIICAGKKVFKPSASLFRKEFAWEEIGILPTDDSPVTNANSFAFTNLATWSETKSPNSPKPFSLVSFLKFAEFTQEDQESQIPPKFLEILRKDEKPVILQNESEKDSPEIESNPKVITNEKKSTTSKLIPPSVVAHEDQPSKKEKYQLVAAFQYPIQMFNPFNLLGTGLTQQTSGTQGVTGPQNMVPVLHSPVQNSLYTFPFKTSNQAHIFPPLLRQESKPISPVSPIAGPFPFEFNPYQTPEIPLSFQPHLSPLVISNPYKLPAYSSFSQLPNDFSLPILTPSQNFPNPNPNFKNLDSGINKIYDQLFSGNLLNTLNLERKPVADQGSLPSSTLGEAIIAGKQTPSSISTKNFLFDLFGKRESENPLLTSHLPQETDSILSTGHVTDYQGVMALPQEIYSV